MIRAGVIGCGKIAQTRHLPEYASNDMAEVAGVYDLNHERAEAMAQKYGGKVYGSYEEMLADPGIDAVSVCVANASHCEVSVAAMRAGKHVLCEKPMAVTLKECEEMVRVSKETGRHLMIGHNQRFARTHKKAKEMIEAGEIGEIITFKTSFGHSGPENWTIDRKNNWFFDKKKAQFGAMADLGVHKTDLIQFLTGHRVRTVSAFIGTLDKKDSSGNLVGVDDNAICIYQMDNGITGTMTASWTYYGKEDNSTVLYGTKGVMYLYCNPEYSLVIEKRDGTNIFCQIDQIQTNENQSRSGIIDEWIDCLVQNHEPEISGSEALWAMKAVFAASRSAESGRTITIEPEGGIL